MDRGAWLARVHRVAKSQHSCVTNTFPLFNKTYNQRESTVDLRKLYSVLCGDLDRKEIQKRGDMCVCYS